MGCHEVLLFTSPTLMNLHALASVSASFFASFALAASKDYDGEGCSLISSDSSSSSLSFSLPEYGNRALCTLALQEILAHPYETAYKYFAPIEKAVRFQSGLLLNPSTRVATAQSLSARYGVTVYISDASGQFIYEPTPLPLEYDQFLSTARSWALNAGVVSTTGNGQVWFTFPIFDNFGFMLTISLVQLTSNMPLNQICYRQNRRY